MVGNNSSSSPVEDDGEANRVVRIVSRGNPHVRGLGKLLGHHGVTLVQSLEQRIELRKLGVENRAVSCDTPEGP